MSFSSYKQEINVGDTVVVYLSVNNIYSITIKQGDVFQTKYGALKHDDLIGKQFGKKVQCTKGWVYILHPNPELWTLTLPHRTQILYTPDISLIAMYLELKPGSKVCEAGTGSGSLSHAILRTVYPDGHLFTFDFHAQRVDVAKQEFIDHGFDDMVTAEARDVVADGFGLEGVVDAVFLDLPLPWEVVPSAVKAMKKNGGRFCSFSPCIEQVQRTCLALASNGFSDITTMECVQKAFEVRTISLPVICSGKNEMHENDDENWAEKKKNFATALPPLRMTGHTGFLTFASLNSKQME